MTNTHWMLLPTVTASHLSASAYWRLRIPLRKVSTVTSVLALLAFGVLVPASAQSPAVRDQVGTAAAPTAAPLGTKSPAQLLDEEEIATLSQRNQNPGPEVRGGALSNEHLTYIVIALAAIVLVLVLK